MADLCSPDLSERVERGTLLVVPGALVKRDRPLLIPEH